MKEKIIGYWRNDRDEETFDFPVPVANSATADEKEQMLFKLAKFKEKAATRYYKGISMCRICGCFNHTGEFVKRDKKTTELTVIPEGLEHYIKEHNVFVPDLYNLKV
jgi:hypothetical protein